MVINIFLKKIENVSQLNEVNIMIVMSKKGPVELPLCGVHLLRGQATTMGGAQTGETAQLRHTQDYCW